MLVDRREIEGDKKAKVAPLPPLTDIKCTQNISLHYANNNGLGFPGGAVIVTIAIMRVHQVHDQLQTERRMAARQHLAQVNRFGLWAEASIPMGLLL